MLTPREFLALAFALAVLLGALILGGRHDS